MSVLGCGVAQESDLHENASIIEVNERGGQRETADRASRCLLTLLVTRTMVRCFWISSRTHIRPHAHERCFLGTFMQVFLAPARRHSRTYLSRNGRVAAELANVQRTPPTSRAAPPIGAQQEVRPPTAGSLLSDIRHGALLRMFRIFYNTVRRACGYLHEILRISRNLEGHDVFHGRMFRPWIRCIQVNKT